MAELVIREAKTEDWPVIWAMLEPVFRAGETYAYAPDITEAEAKRIWTELPRACFIAESAGEVLGTYYIKANQPGLGDHVCNCGYVTAAQARGRGIARQMCEHSQVAAREFGYRAMQYNLVVASNLGAVALWQKLGFEITGTLKGAFRHASLGYVDAHVMYKDLTADE